MAIVFRLPTLSKRDPTQVFSCEYCKIFKNTYFEGYLRTPAYEYHFTYYFGVLFLRPHFNVLLSIMIQCLKRCKDNVVLSTILRRCCDVLITTSSYQQHNNVAWTSFKWRYFYNVGATSWYSGTTSRRYSNCNKRHYNVACLLGYYIFMFWHVDVQRLRGSSTWSLCISNEAKWLRVHLQTKWLWHRFPLQLHQFQTSRLFWGRRTLTFRQPKKVDSL